MIASMNNFRPVNTSLAPDTYARNGEETTPTTPRPSTAPHTQPAAPRLIDDATTPTRANFGAGALASQRPLPAEPFPAMVGISDTPQEGTLNRGNSMKSSASKGSKGSKGSDDVTMDGSDVESGTESTPGDGKSKKKKSQRFYCIDYPPCTLSFTRSEHLARHVR